MRESKVKVVSSGKSDGRIQRKEGKGKEGREKRRYL